MKNLRSYLSVFIILVGLSAVAQETNSPKFGKGLFNLVGKDSTWTMKIGARMQFLTTNAWDLDANGDFGKAQNTFLLKERNRLIYKYKFDRNVE